jgi:hypothetical protein
VEKFGIYRGDLIVEIEEKSVLKIKIRIPGCDTVEQYTAQLDEDNLRLEGPFDESFYTIPVHVFEQIAQWVERKTNEHN